MDRKPPGWLQRHRERSAAKTLRTGDSPEKIAERRRKGGAPDEEPGFVEKVLWPAEEGGLARGQARNKTKESRD